MIFARKNARLHNNTMRSRPGRGQKFEAEAEVEAKSLRLRPKFWPRGHCGLKDLTSLRVGRLKLSSAREPIPYRLVIIIKVARFNQERYLVSRHDLRQSELVRQLAICELFALQHIQGGPKMLPLRH